MGSLGPELCKFWGLNGFLEAVRIHGIWPGGLHASVEQLCEESRKKIVEILRAPELLESCLEAFSRSVYIYIYICMISVC